MLRRVVCCTNVWKAVAFQSPPQISRVVSTSTVCSQGIPKHSSRPKLTEKIPDGRGCPLCRAGLHKFGYRDILLLRQFLSPNGYPIGRRQTGVCPKMQRRINKAIRRSRQMGLMPNFKLQKKTDDDKTVDTSKP